MTIPLTENQLRMINKVPEVTIFFWLIKIMATTVGETAADFLIFNWQLGLSLTSLLMGVLLAMALFIQVRATRYIPALYWVAVVLISIFGTLITDNLVDNFGMDLVSATVIFSLALLATFIAWYISENTLSIRTIYSVRREVFYWAAILFTFALGTAAGDLAAEGWGLGYALSAIIFGGLIALVAISHYVFKVNVIVAFWLAYILTRPFGASCGDLLSQPASHGGLGLGTVITSAIFLLTILGLVTYLTIIQKQLADRRS